METLSGPVGEGGRNNAADVRLIQHLLNDWLGRRQQILLKVDGLAGPKTITAIRSFQRENTGIADGRVDPGGPAIAKLLELHLANLAAILNPVAPAGQVDFAAIRGSKQTDKLVAGAVGRYLQALKSGG